MRRCAAFLAFDTHQETGGVDQKYQRDIERVAQGDEAGGLAAGIGVQGPAFE
ncbi:hypothetical protein D3C87_2166440 [compost metagenome]